MASGFLESGRFLKENKRFRILSGEIIDVLINVDYIKENYQLRYPLAIVTFGEGAASSV